jgi:IS4 transposase
MPLKANRCIALTKEDYDNHQFVKLSQCTLEEATEVYLKGWDRPVRLTKLSIKDGADRAVALYLVCSNLLLSHNQIQQLYQRRWTIEVAFKSMKSNLNLHKSPTHSNTAIHNHIFCVFLATVELSFLALHNSTNPFALKLVIYNNALKIALKQTDELRRQLHSAA